MGGRVSSHESVVPSASLLTADEASEEVLPPESLYNYCIQRLLASNSPCTEKALLYLGLLVIEQSIVMAAFVVYNDINNNAIGVLPVDDRTVSLGHCMTSKSNVYGSPLIEYCMGIVAILLVASVIR